MATSRTGTTKYKMNRVKALRRDRRDGITRCPSCRVFLDYDTGRRPNSAEADHIIPHAQGGTDHHENLRALCRRCNQSRGDRTTLKSTHAQSKRRSRTVQAIDFTTVPAAPAARTRRDQAGGGTPAPAPERTPRHSDISPRYFPHEMRF